MRLYWVPDNSTIKILSQFDPLINESPNIIKIIIGYFIFHFGNCNWKSIRFSFIVSMPFRDCCYDMLMNHEVNYLFTFLWPFITYYLTWIYINIWKCFILNSGSAICCYIQTSILRASVKSCKLLLLTKDIPN